MNLNESTVAVRENRLQAITGYKGCAGKLACSSSCGEKNRGRCFSQATSCSSSDCQTYLAGIYDAAIVNHAPAGCGSDAIVSNMMYRDAAQKGNRFQNAAVFSTNMTKSDTVFGAIEKLKQTVREAYRRYHPKAIFITASCTSGIIGEDIDSALNEIRDEIPVPLAPVFCEGFKSSVWASGWDAAFHAILKYVVQPPRKRSNKINVINFRPSPVRKEITELFEYLGFEPTFIIPHCGVEDLLRLSEAAATVSVCETLSSYVGNALEELYGVPYVRTLSPQGHQGFEAWVRELGRVTGTSRKAEEYLAAQQDKHRDQIEAVKKKLKGNRVVIGMGPVLSFEYSRVLLELGVKVEWVFAWHYDQNYDDGRPPKALRELAELNPGLPLSVSDMQSFEITNVLNRIKPDLFVCRHPGLAHIATKLGIATYMLADSFLAFGDKGLINFGNTIYNQIKYYQSDQRVVKRLRSPYTDWWLKQDSFSLLEEGFDR